MSTEHAAKRVLAAAGLPMLPETLCTNVHEACRRAGDRLSGGGEDRLAGHRPQDRGRRRRARLRDAAAVRGAFDQLMTRASQAMPRAKLEGVLIAPMVKGGIEVIAAFSAIRRSASW
jgi:acyl-CoA synthetase (NDP forming)